MLNDPPKVERVTTRFSETKLSSSNFPSLTLTHGLWKRLSSLTLTDSKWKAPRLSDEGTSRKEIFLSSVPPVRISSPVKSKPVDVSLRIPGVPAGVSKEILSVLSRCQKGMMRSVIGQYDGFCHIGASLSFIS